MPHEIDGAMLGESRSARLAAGAGLAVIVGLAPSPFSHPEKPFTGSSGRRLADLIDIPMETFLHVFDRANLFDRCLEPWFSSAPEEAEMSLQGLQKHLAGQMVLLIGRNVQAAFGIESLDFLRWRTVERHRCIAAVLPSCVGIGEWWLKDENDTEARRFLRAWCDHLGETLMARYLTVAMIEERYGYKGN